MYTVKEKRVRKFRFKCSECGSENVAVFATVYWSFDRQEWVFEDFTGQDDWCNECECEVTAEEVAVFVDPPSWPTES